MAAHAPVGAVEAESPRLDAVRVSLRRVLLPVLGVAIVVAASAVPGTFVPPATIVLIPYTVLIWVLYPAVAALLVVCLGALATGRALPSVVTAVVVAGTTTAWTAWGRGDVSGATYGLVTGLGGAAAGAVLAAPWRSGTRLVVALAIVAGTVAALLVLQR